MIIGLLFIGLVIYIIVCMVQQKEIDKQKEKEAERYRTRPMTKQEKEIEELKQKLLDETYRDGPGPV